MGAPSLSGPKRRRERGDDGISWDKINKCYMGTISLGIDGTGKRRRRTVRGKTKTEVKDKLDALHEEIKAGIQTPAAYTVRQCVTDWLDSLELDPHTMATYRGQAEKWIYPAIGATKLKDFKATDADRFFRNIAQVLSKASLVKIKSTLVRSIRRAQKYDLIGRNVAELVDLPQGRPGHPSRAMSEEQAGKVLQAASGQASGLRQGGEGEPGPSTRRPTRPPRPASWPAARGRASRLPLPRSAPTSRRPPAASVARNSAWTIRPMRAAGSKHCSCCPSRSAFVPGSCASSRGITWTWTGLSSTCGGRRAGPGTSRRRSRSGPSSCPGAPFSRSRRTGSVRPRNGLPLASAWHDNNLVFCHEDGRMYSSKALNWRFGKMTRRAGIGHWHAHEGRHTAVSIMSSNGVPLQEISDTVGHKSTHVTETVYRHVIVPAIRGGASVMDTVFGDDTERGNGAADAAATP